MKLNELNAISPVDGRYLSKTQSLSNVFSELGLIKYRLEVEIRWFIKLCDALPDLDELNNEEIQALESIIENFDESEAQKVKEIESKTNHDLKAVEYYIKEKFKNHAGLNQRSEFIHFACTSEDVNNLAYALMVKDGREELVEHFTATLNSLYKLANDNASVSMLSRTHGQSASPTTLGKEFANVAYRLKRQLKQFEETDILGKINGAVGNYNAHFAAYPDVDWLNVTMLFVNSFGLEWNSYTTQIEPHDFLAEQFDCIARMNTILIDFSRDMWAYISNDYFTQTLKEGEVGSSTMPHKVNPIDFENAEGNFGIANALLNHFSAKLPISRWQRDLSDSTVLRNIGVAYAHTLLANTSLNKGLSKCKTNESVIAQDLDQHWEVLGEALQTVMRRYGIEKPYEKLKAFTRGKTLHAEELSAFIDGLELPGEVKERLKNLAPNSYLGIACELARDVEKH